MNRVTLLQVGPTTTETRYHVMLNGCRVGVATEITADRVTPWRLTIPGTCSNLRRSSREVLLATVERLLADRPPSSVVYVPTSPTGHWHLIAAELRAAGFEVRPTPAPSLPRHAVVPLVLVSSREV